MFSRRPDKIDFVIAGAQKSGTTALYYLLSAHPEIAFPTKQELHFFDDEDAFAGPVNYDALHQQFALGRKTIVSGECTPIYLYWKPALGRIAQYNPRMKVIVTLRNPITRAFAHWNMQRHKKREPLDFMEALRAEPARAREAASLQSRYFSYVDRGLYAGQLERLFNLFPPEQITVIKFEEFQHDNPGTLHGLCDFLGVSTLKSIAQKDRNVVPYEREMRDDEREYLRGIFRADISRVESILGWDCSDWR